MKGIVYFMSDSKKPYEVKINTIEDLKRIVDRHQCDVLVDFDTIFVDEIYEIVVLVHDDYFY